MSEINSIDPRLRAQAERIARNFPIQGTCADLCKMAMVLLDKKNVIGEDCKLLLQIHDELLFEVKKEQLRQKASQVKNIMENVFKLSVPLEVEIKVGPNWKELEPFGKIKYYS